MVVNFQAKNRVYILQEIDKKPKPVYHCVRDNYWFILILWGLSNMSVLFKGGKSSAINVRGWDNNFVEIKIVCL